jgi:molybdate transport system substrate-binding protein
MKLEFVSAGAAHGLVSTVARERGIEVAGSFGAVGAQLEKFRGGVPCDLLILTDAQVTALAASGEVLADTCADLGAVATSVAVRADSAMPDVATPEALRSALLAADALYFPDPAKATAGIHFAKVIDGLGIRTQVESRLMTFPNGATAMAAMAKAGGNPIGCTQATEILATPGIRLVAPLPKGCDLETVYTISVNAKAERLDAARDFARDLAGEGARGARASAGFVGHAIRPADAGDAAAVRGIVDSVLAEYRITADPAGTDRDLADLDAYYFSRGGGFIVAVASDGRLVGSCGIAPLEGGTWDLRKMYLLPEARGHGLGKRLLARVLAFAKSKGATRVELETASVLKEAISLYGKAGFTPIDRPLQARRCDKAYALEL